MPSYDDVLRPIAHITPGTGWVNDPNGPIFHDGLFHIYYQLNPVAPLHQDIRWGHSTSSDLVSWTAQPVAIHPSTDLDRDGVYSGMTVTDDGRVVAYFSGYRTDRRYQPVLRAVSPDGGYTFEPATQVVAEPDPELGVDEYRDPFVWRDADGWKMLVGSALPDNHGAALLYSSADGLEWSYRGVFAQAHPRDIQLGWGIDPGNMWEVPQLVTVDGDDFLIVSGFRRGTGPMRVFTLAGTVDGERFEISGSRYFDDGPDFFAASVLTTPDGRTLVWGWGRESLRVPAPMTSWAGVLTLPRELRRRADGQLGSWPARELELLRGTEIAIPDAGPVSSVPRSFELTATVTLDGGRARGVLELAFGAAGEGITIIVDGTVGTVVVDPAGAYTAAVIELPAGQDEVELRWFFDRSVSELFVDGGGVATHRIYPPEHGEWSLSAEGAVKATGLWAIESPKP